MTDVVTLHNGYYDAAEVIFDEVVAAIEPLLEEGRRLWITGHSLGGAVATLTAFRLEFEEGIPVHGVHVFGAPAVGDSDWVAVFEDTVTNFHRWNLEGDPAPVATQAPMFYHAGIINNLYTDRGLVLDGTNMFIYLSQCWPGYGALVVHMNYWSRMHEELKASHPHLVDLFPAALPSPPLGC
jgi:pimeloyl-ACP methyl ester carboxylesterase